MSNQSFTTTFTVDQPPQEVFNAVNDVRGWWSEDIDGGTTNTFEIAEKSGKTEVRFTHDGLVPEHECFGVCQKAWTFYIGTSLSNLITTGAGRPNPRGRLGTLPDEAVVAR